MSRRVVSFAAAIVIAACGGVTSSGTNNDAGVECGSVVCSVGQKCADPRCAECVDADAAVIGQPACPLGTVVCGTTVCYGVSQPDVYVEPCCAPAPQVCGLVSAEGSCSSTK